MALGLTRTYTYSSTNTIASNENNTNENALYNAFTGLEAGTSSMSKLPLDADPTSALYAATKQYVDAYANYRRPSLTFVSVTTVDVEANTGTANQTKIVFPDGNYRSVTEDTSSTNKYRRFLITATAEFTSGTEDSGLFSGLSEAANTWYAIYAVKSTINTANFVLVGTTTLPTTANFSTLNSNFGTNGWVYLGLIRNGDNVSATTDILTFFQSANMTILNNLHTASSAAQDAIGMRLANTAGAATLTYTYSAGTGATNIPNHLGFVYWSCGVAVNGTGGSSRVRNSAGDRQLQRMTTESSTLTRFFGVASDGIQISNSSGASIAYDIILAGWVDNVLGVGSNPLV